MRIVGDIFYPPLNAPPGVIDTRELLESSKALYWLASLYFRYLQTAHGIWDETDDRIGPDNTYYVECQATQRELRLTVHNPGDVFELVDGNGRFRIVFRCESRAIKPDEDAPPWWDYIDRIEVDRIDGDEAEIRRWFTHIKLTGEEPEFQVIG